MIHLSLLYIKDEDKDRKFLVTAQYHKYNVPMLSVVMLGIIMLSIIVQSVIAVNIIMLSVVAPYLG